MHSDTTEGYEYEPAENAAAKDVAMDALEKALTDQGREPYDEVYPIELIGLADAVVEALLKVGVIIPDGLQSPFIAHLNTKE